MYAMQKNESVKEVMEEVVKKLLRGGQGMRPRMLKVINKKFREDIDELKKVLREACFNSIRLNSTDKGTAIQVIISEFGDVRFLETPKGIVPMSVIDSKAYLLYEFECITDIQTYRNTTDILSGNEVITPLAGQYKDFMEWLIKHGIFEEIEYEYEINKDNDYENVIAEVFQRYFFKYDDDPTEYLNLVYRWNPTKYREIINIIRENNLSSYVEEQVEKGLERNCLQRRIGTEFRIKV
ncbi:hypothetical protein ACT7CW_05515 [Bacillus pacificus]